MSRFAPFNRIDLPYCVINGVPLLATILIPSGLLSSPRSDDQRFPVMVRWHGGGFVVGHRMYEPWFAQWLLDLSLQHNAIIITADYRLLPESTGSDLLSDIAHFWRWLQTDLPFCMRQRDLPRPDISNILCCGESSGGFISVYCAFQLDSMLEQVEQEDTLVKTTASNSYEEKNVVKATVEELGNQVLEGAKVKIKAIISISAPLDTTAPEYKVPRPRIFMGRSPPPPRQALAKIRSYIEEIPPGSLRTGCEPTSEMWELLLCIAQQAALPRLFGRGASEECRSTLGGLMETLDRVGAGEKKMLPVWIVHGLNDTMCPSACSSGFVHRLLDVQPDVPLHLSLCPGEHLFDVDASRDADWVQEGEAFLQKHWPC